jgi:hypothetical protein
MTNATRLPRRVSLRGMRAGSYIPDTRWPQVDAAPPRRGHNKPVFVGQRNHDNERPPASPLMRTTR